MRNKTILVVEGYGYESIGDFLMINHIKTDYTLLNRLLGPIESGDYVRIPLKHYGGEYKVYNIFKV